MNNTDYWQARLIDDIYTTQTKSLEKKLIKVYKQANKSIDEQLQKLWLDMLQNGEISANTLYKSNRYRALQDVLQRELYKLGITEQEYVQLTLLDSFKQAYIGTNKGYNLITDWTIFNDNLAKSIVQANFKGATYSERIWNNMDKLRTLIEKKIIESTMIGNDIRKISREIKNSFSTSYSDAERLVRTETMRCLNSAQMQSYIDNGYKQYKILSARDSRTSEICRELDGSVFNFTDAVIGENYPPLHVQCRSIGVPVIE